MSITPMTHSDIPDTVYELYPPGPIDIIPAVPAHRACLLAWAAVNRLPINDMLGNRRITVNASARTIEYWVRGDAPGTPGASILQAPIGPIARNGARLERLPLTAEPGGILIGDKVCGHMIRPASTTWRCNIEVDAHGRHPGAHADGLHDNTEWPNEHPGVLPYRRGRPDVTGRPPTEQHALVLAAVDELAGAPHIGSNAARHVEGLAGRRRILERHGPGLTRVANAARLGRHWCADEPHQLSDVSFPCLDYLDAAAGLVTGLPTGD